MKIIKIIILLLIFTITTANAKNSEPCDGTTVQSRNVLKFRPAIGIYACTVKKNTDGVIIAWAWVDKATIITHPRYKSHYAFNCKSRMTKSLAIESGGMVYEDFEGEWLRPKPGTTADKWLGFICKNEKYY